jgi:hypothetical protein
VIIVCNFVLGPSWTDLYKYVWTCGAIFMLQDSTPTSSSFAISSWDLMRR